MRDDAIRLTDPATELAALWDQLAQIPADSRSAFLVLAHSCGIEHDSSALLELLGVIGGRIERLRTFAREVEDPFMTTRMRESLSAHLRQMSGMFAPNQLVQNWENYKSSFINDAQITVLESVSGIVQRHQPLRKLGDDERSELISKIELVLSGDDFGDLPPWAAAPLREGFQRLLFSLRHLRFFGYESVIDQLIALQHRSSIISQNFATPAQSEDQRSAFQTLLRIAEVVALAVHLFIAPHHVSEAYHHYRGYLLPEHHQPMKLLPAPVKAIAAPVAPKERRAAKSGDQSPPK